jgi:hypothetical protein
MRSRDTTDLEPSHTSNLYAISLRCGPHDIPTLLRCTADHRRCRRRGGGGIRAEPSWRRCPRCAVQGIRGGGRGVARGSCAGASTNRSGSGCVGEHDPRAPLLVAGRLVASTSAPMAVRAATEPGSAFDGGRRRSRIASSRAIAGPTVRFVDAPDNDQLRAAAAFWCSPASRISTCARSRHVPQGPR